MKKPTLASNWSTRASIETPHFARTMPRNRFELLKRYFHFSDNETADTSDPLYKVRAVSDYLVQRFKALYIPAKQLSVDEAMLLWKGRLGFKVYQPCKPIK